MYAVIIVIVFHWVLMTSSREQVAFFCVGDRPDLHCFSLNGQPGAQWKWYEAFDYCRQRQLYPVAILDQNIQHLLAEKIGTRYGFQRAWTSGRRSKNTSWTSLDSTLFNIDFDIEKNNTRDKNCLKAELDTGTHALRYEAYDCDAALYPVCQIKASDRCFYPEFLVNDVCYRVVQRHMTWYEAVSVCASMAPTSTIASHHNKAVSGGLAQHVPPGIGLWLGYRRRPWQWINGNYGTPMSYYNWKHTEKKGADVCASLEEDLYLWNTIGCNDTLDYVICEKRPLASNTPRPVVLTTGQSLTTEKYLTTHQPNGDPENERTHKSFQIAVGFSVFLAVLVIILMIYIVFKHISSKTSHNSTITLFNNNHEDTQHDHTNSIYEVMDDVSTIQDRNDDRGSHDAGTDYERIGISVGAQDYTELHL